VLDLAFRQDERRARRRHAARNRATLPHRALTLLRAETTSRVGISAKRHNAGWDHASLLKVLQLLSLAIALGMLANTCARVGRAI
jgi:hypothetical protein